VTVYAYISCGFGPRSLKGMRIPKHARLYSHHLL
jgi:hypothetical protein